MKKSIFLVILVMLANYIYSQNATSTPPAAETYITKKAIKNQKTTDPFTQVVNGELTLLSSPSISISNNSANSIPRLSVNGFNQERLIIYLDDVKLAQNATGGYDIKYLLGLKFSTMKIVHGGNGFVEIYLTREKEGTPFSIYVGNTSLAPSMTVSSMFAQQTIGLAGFKQINKSFAFSYDIKGEFGYNDFSQDSISYQMPNFFIAPNINFIGSTKVLDYNFTLRSSYQNFKTTDDLGYGGYPVIKGSEKEQATLDTSLKLDKINLGIENSLASFNIGYNLFYYKDYGVLDPTLTNANHNKSQQIDTVFSQDFYINTFNTIGYNLNYKSGFYNNNGYNYNDGYNPAVEAFDGQLHQGSLGVNYQYNQEHWLVNSQAKIHFSSLKESLVNGSALLSTNYHYLLASPSLSFFTNINYPTLATLYYVSPYYNYNSNLQAERYSGGRFSLNNKINFWQNNLSVELGSINNAIYADTDPTNWHTTYRNSNSPIFNTITTLAGSFTLPKNWSIRYGYTFTYAMDSNKEFNQFYNYISPHVALFSIHYNTNIYEIALGLRYQSTIYNNIGDILSGNLISPTINIKIIPIQHFYVKLEADMILPENEIIDAYNPTPRFKAELSIGYIT